MTIQGFRLSPQQRRLWRLGAEEGSALCSQGVLALAGPLDAAALRTALESVTARHDALRTTFRRTAGVRMPVQSIAPGAPGAPGDIGGPAWRTLECGPLAAAERQARIADLLRQEAELVDPERGPALRALLCTFAPGEAALLLSLPAVCADGWSLETLAAEVRAAYAGEPAEEPVQYVQYSEWLNELLESEEEAEAGRAFWRRQEGEDLAWPQLPGELRAESGGRQPLAVSLPLPPGVAARAEEVAAARGATLPSFLLACWHALLCRAGGAARVAVARVVDGRKFEELHGVLGPFASWVPVVAHADGADDLFSTLLERVHGAATDGEKVQEFFVPEAAEGVPPGRLPVAFEHRRERVIGEAAGVSFVLAGRRAPVDRFKLLLSCIETAAGLRVELTGEASLYTAADLWRLAGGFAALVESAAAAPDAAVADLDALSPRDRRELLVEWNDTGAPIPAADFLTARVRELAARTPEAPAVEMEGEMEGERLTYGELAGRAGRLAAHLRRMGVGPDVLVAVGLGRGPDLVVSLLAVLESGGAYLPLDPGHPDERLALVLAEARPAVLLTSGALAERFAGITSAIPETVLLRLDARAEEEGEAPPVALSGDHLAYVLYTSGSTGRPKGVMVTRRGLANYLAWAAAAYPVAGGGAPVHSPAGFDLTVTSLFLPLLAGGSAVLVPEERGAEGLAAALRDSAGRRGGRSGFDLVKVTPSHLSLLAQWLAPEQAAGRMAALVIGGEALQAEHLFFWRSHAPATRLINEYGPTEAVVGCCVHEVDPAADLSGPVPIGKPIANTRLYVLDDELRVLPAGAVGELFIGGAGLARGYLGRPDLTAERFVPDPFETGGRLYRSGDLVRLGGDGLLHYLGRRDHQVKVRGYRIELGEIESLLADHPAVGEAAVLVREDAPGDRRLVAYVAPRSGETPAAPGLRAFLEARLPDYMVPAAFVVLPAFPLTANGKVDRAALPAPGSERPDLAVAYAAPETVAEEVLAAVVGQVLGVDRVGVNDNFFALGGDSIRSVQVVALARDRGYELRVEDLFEHQTVRRLAESLRLPAGLPEPVAAFSLVTAADRALLPAEVEDAYPLTRLQAGMLYHMSLTPERPVFHNVNTWHIRAPFDAAAMQAAVDALVARHPVMRTAFDLTSYGQPLQLVYRQAELPVPVEDLRHLSADGQEAALRAFWEAENRHAFDLRRPPLVRYFVHRRSDDSFQFTLTELHAVVDGWSTTSNLAEIFTLYHALRRDGSLPAQPPLAYGFRDYVAAELAALACEESRRFWAEKLAGCAPTRMPRLPAAALDPAPAPFAKLLCPVPDGVFAGVRELARREAVPVKSPLLAVYAKALATLTGEAELVTALASNGRLEVPGGTQIRGLFLNMLPLRFAPAAGSWRELARRAFAAERELVPHRRYPLPAIQKAWGGHDLGETMFNYLNFHSVDEVIRQGDGEVLPDDEMDFSYTNFVLHLSFTWLPASDRLLMLVEYKPAELAHEQGRAFQACCLRALEALAAEPDACHDALCLLAPAERQQVTVAWNGPDTPYPAGSTVHAAFARAVTAAPAAEALRFGGDSFTFAGLRDRANRLARHLRELGLRPEERVGLCLERSADMVVAMLAVLAAGGAYVPLDTAYPAERLAFMIEDAGVGLLLTTTELAGRLPQGTAARPVLLDADAAAIAARPADPLPEHSGPDHLAYVIYTSGSTGRPKGVAVPHRGVLRLVLDTDYVRLGAADRVAQAANASFDAATFEIWGPLLNGGCVVGIEREVALSPRRLAAAVREQGITTLFITTALFHQIAAEAPETFSPLTHLLFGGEAIDPRRVRQILAGSPPARLLHVYGPTESTTYATWHLVEEVAPDAVTVPIGRALANTRAYVVDGWFQPLPLGAPGELCLGGAGLARGYLGRPDLTAERFVPDPLSGDAGARLYRTGDLVRWVPGGAMEFLGRRDGQVKVRGFRIELGELEAVLARHPAVDRVVAAVYEPAPGDRRLVAYPVFVAGEAPGDEELRDFLRRELPEHMVPAAFVPLAELPLNPNGKVDRRALPSPAGERSARGPGYVAPRTATEELLAAVWSRVLGIERVGLADDFFALGGDSILSLRVVALARESGVPLSIEQLFSNPVLGELARELETAMETGDAGADLPRTRPFDLIPAADLERLPEGIEDAYPVTHLQLGMLFHIRLAPESPAYHNVNSWHLRAPFDAAAFRLAVDRAVARHPALRTSFALSGYSEPLQLVHAEALAELGFADLRGLPAAAQEEVLAAFVRAEHGRPFDLSRPPLVRYHLHRRSDDTFQLTLTECHAISDGWSTTSTLAGIFRDYLLLAAGAVPPEEPEPGMSFRDFVALERRTLASTEAAGYWERVLAGAAPAGLPVWPDAAAGPGGPRARKVQAEVPPEVLAGIERLARAEVVPVKSVLLAAHVHVMAWLTGSPEVLTGLTVNGRPEHADAERVHGLFLNTLPFRLELAGGSWRELVREAFRAEREALPFRRYPLAAMTAMAAQQRGRGRQALLETSFNYVSFHSVRDVLRDDRMEILEGDELDLAFSNFALSATFSLSPVASRLWVGIECEAARFAAVQAERIAAAYLAALSALAAGADARYDAVDLLPLPEEPAADGEEPRLFLHDCVTAHALARPEAPAAIFEDEPLTYSELDRLGNQLARRLRALGVAPGDIVAIAMERSLELVVAVFGVLKAGAAFLPIDPVLPAPRIAFMLEDARPAALLTQPHLAAALPAGGIPVLELDAAWRELAGEDAAPLDAGVAAESLAYVIYTSGSTGTPKGVLVRHGGLANLMLAQRRSFGVTPEERVLQFASLSFDAAVFEIAMATAPGAALQLERRESLLPGRGFAELLRRRGITNLTMPPSVLALVPADAAAELPALRTVIVAGEACPAELAARWAPGRRFFNAYGPTETTVWASVGLVDETVVEAGGKPPIGTAVAGVTLHVLDPWLRPVPTGTAGELFIGGEGVARGYLRRPDLTARSFVPDRWSARPGARLYRSGDLVRRLPDGRLEFVGRADSQVKVRGFRTEPGEIEAVLGQHPAVRQAAVVARDDGGEGKRLVAYWSPRTDPGGDGPEPGVSELRAFLGERLPAYMVPALFVRLESLPLTTSGKVDRRALPEAGSARPELAAAYAAPRTPSEHLVAQVWRDVLGLEGVGIHDNFFDLGGDSLLLLQVHERLQAATGRELPLVFLFELPTVSALAERLADPGTEPGAEAEAAESADMDEGRSRLLLQLQRSRMADMEADFE